MFGEQSRDVSSDASPTWLGWEQSAGTDKGQEVGRPKEKHLNLIPEELLGVCMQYPKSLA